MTPTLTGNEENKNFVRERERKLFYAPLFPVSIYSSVLPLVKGEGEYLITSVLFILFYLCSYNIIEY